MAHQYLCGFLLVIACLAVGVSSYPSNNEEPTTLTLDLLKETLEAAENESEERSLADEQILIKEDDNTKAIMDKIKAINEGLKRPHRRPQIKWDTQPSTGGGYIMDKEILQKLQQIIASGKLHGLAHHEDVDYGLNELRRARQVNLFNRNSLPNVPGPYIMNIPVLVMSPYNMYNPTINDISDAGSYQTKQNPTSPSFPSLPFQFQWPFASFFPLLIRDPLLSILNGGGWSNFIEYGQNADVCNRKQKSIDDESNELGNAPENEAIANIFSLDPAGEYNSREARSIKKRTVSQGSLLQELENAKTTKKIISTKLTTTRKPNKQDSFEDTKTSDEGKLIFPFGDFTLFGNKKPVAPTPGFFINRLKVRKGGVAIAGPGGVATAGRGGAAIVGPGGLAYTQPGGLAVAGPAARVVALSPDIDLSSVVTRLQEQAATDGSVPNLLKAIPEGKVVATGPVVYYHSNQYHREWRSRDVGKWYSGIDGGTNEYKYDGVAFGKGPLKMKDSNFMLFLKPVAHALSAKGTAVANPISQVVVARDQAGSIVHTPVAAAVVGPGGVAHAQSDLYLYEYVTN